MTAHVVDDSHAAGMMPVALIASELRASASP